MNGAISKLVDNIRPAILEIPKSQKADLFFNVDKTRIIKLFCAYHDFGEQIADWELETIEIVLGRRGFSYQVIEDVSAMVYIVKNRDYILTNRDHFENAVQILNDDVIYMDKTFYQPSYKILWTIILLMSLYGAENMPVTGDALEYIAECFKDEGWTQPPLFFADIKRFDNLFPYYDEEFIMKALKPVKDIMEMENIKAPSDGFENYYKFHLPLIHYLMDKTTELQKQIASIVG